MEEIQEEEAQKDILDGETARRLAILENECRSKMERAFYESKGKTPVILCRTNYKEYNQDRLNWEDSFKRLQARGRFNNMKLVCKSDYTEWDQSSGYYGDEQDPNGFWTTECNLTILRL